MGSDLMEISSRELLCGLIRANFMNIQDFKRLIRKSHRYLGVFIGIQFLLWTISGLYFSWTNINEIRGNHLREDKNVIKTIDGVTSPSEIQQQISNLDPDAQIRSFRIVKILDTNYFEVVYSDRKESESTALFDTKTGKRRNPITQTEAEKIATDALRAESKIQTTTYLNTENVGSHHEYRGKPLPAWAVSFDHPEELTVYLSANNGQIESFRTSNWRIFDFLWMLHTMDFVGRDDINNWALRIFSGLSLLMIVSGFLYFFITFKKPW